MAKTTNRAKLPRQRPQLSPAQRAARERLLAQRSAALVSDEEQRMRDDRARIQRELMLQRRLVLLSRQLNTQTVRAARSLAELGTHLAEGAGNRVVSPGHVRELEEENIRLSKRVAQLEEELGEIVRAGDRAGV